MLHLRTRESDTVIGTQVTGRDTVESEQLIGVFTNSLVLRTNVQEKESFANLLMHVRETVLEALANQTVSFERLVGELKPARDFSASPLFSINFIFQRAFVRNQKFAGVSLIDLPSRSSGSLFDLNFFMVERVDGWRASCEYNVDLYHRATVEQMLAQYQMVLEGVALDPNRELSKLANIQPREPEMPAGRGLKNEADSNLPILIRVQPPSRRERCCSTEFGRSKASGAMEKRPWYRSNRSYRGRFRFGRKFAESSRPCGPHFERVRSAALSDDHFPQSDS